MTDFCDFGYNLKITLQPKSQPIFKLYVVLQQCFLDPIVELFSNKILPSTICAVYTPNVMLSIFQKLIKRKLSIYYFLHVVVKISIRKQRVADINAESFWILPS